VHEIQGDPSNERYDYEQNSAEPTPTVGARLVMRPLPEVCSVVVRRSNRAYNNVCYIRSESMRRKC
jgi:hypothetical protein